MPSLSLPIARRAPTHLFPALYGCLVLPVLLLGGCGKAPPSSAAAKAAAATSNATADATGMVATHATQADFGEAAAPAQMAADGLTGRSGGTVARFQFEAISCLHGPLFAEMCKAKPS